MCKLFAVIDIENQNLVEKFIKKAIPFVTKHDDDGLGIMRLGENGVHIQKWVDIPKDFGSTVKINSPYLRALKIESYETGTKSRRLDAIAIHGRKATCGINLANTHPFTANGSTLMHNGVITNTTPKDNKVSTCDSETLLWRYIENDVKVHPENLDKALLDVMGYYGVILFNDNGVVDIWRDDMANLVLAKVRGIGTVIATEPSLIYATTKRMGLKVDFCYPLLPFTFLRWQRGKQPDIMTFTKPAMTFTSYQAGSLLESDISTYDKDFNSTVKSNVPTISSEIIEKAQENWWVKEKREAMEKDQLEQIKELKEVTV